MISLCVGRSIAILVARFLLATTLALALLSGSLPFTAISAAPMCTLTCCAGRAPHAAGSCMSGACDTGLFQHPKSSKHAHSNIAFQGAEPLCGLGSITGIAAGFGVTPGGIAGRRTRDRTQSKSAGYEQSESVTAAVVVTPCQPDCGGCASGSTNQNRQRDTTALSHAPRPRPPSSKQLAIASREFVNTLEVVCAQSRPRAPPATFSSSL